MTGDRDAISATCINKMKKTKIVSELLKGKKELEFLVEAPAEEEIMREMRVDTAYDYNDYVNLINLDCLDEPDELNTSPFECIAKKMTNVTKDGGVKKQIKRAGFGSVVPENALAYIHYSCYLELEEVPFDSSYLRSSNPFRLQLGKNNYYPGFEIAVLSMLQGEKSQFLVQPQCAFGEMGVPPRIPQNATILLEIELLKFVNCGDKQDGVHETADYESYEKFAEAFKKAKSQHVRGNDHFVNRSYTSAISCYRKAVDLLTSSSLANDEEENNQKHLLSKLYTNLCICYNKVNIPQKACIAARDATYLDPMLANKNAKLHFGWGKALANLSDFKRAADHFKKALSIEPNNQEISQSLIDLEKNRKEHYKHEKITYKKALGLDKCEAECNKEDKNKSSNSELSTDSIGLVKEIEEFAKSSRSRLDIPDGITKEEKQIIQATAKSLGLVYKEIKRPTGNLNIALTK